MGAHTLWNLWHILYWSLLYWSLFTWLILWYTYLFEVLVSHPFPRLSISLGAQDIHGNSYISLLSDYSWFDRAVIQRQTSSACLAQMWFHYWLQSIHVLLNWSRRKWQIGYPLNCTRSTAWNYTHCEIVAVFVEMGTNSSATCFSVKCSMARSIASNQ